MKRLNIGDLFYRDGICYLVTAVKNSIATAKDCFGEVIYVTRGGFAGGA